MSPFLRKWCLLLVLNLIKKELKKIKREKLTKNIKKISAWFLELCWGNWGLSKKMVFLWKNVYGWCGCLDIVFETSKLIGSRRNEKLSMN